MHVSSFHLQLPIILLFVFTESSNLHQYEYKEHNRYRPHLAKKFYGELLEGTTRVNINPPLLASDDDAPERSGLICGYNLHAVYPKDIDIPFFVTVFDKRSGQAEIFLKKDKTLSGCSNYTKYELFISAFDCGTSTNEKRNISDQRTSRKSKLYISFNETNKYNPYFVNWFYSLDVESIISSNQPLVSLHANDDDCGLKNGRICRYEVEDSMKKFFHVTDDGVLFSQTEIIASTEKVFFNFSVTAYDCNGRKSKPANVFIMLYPLCRAGLSGFTKQLNFNSSEASVLLFPNANFTTCIPPKDIVSVQLILTFDLYNVQSESGCVFENSIHSERKQSCKKFKDNLINLLPNKFIFDQLKQFSFSQFILPTHKISNRFFFNGKNQVLVPSSGLLSNYTLKNPFSVYFKMYLSRTYKTKTKSTILCQSDAKDYNRRRFAIYVESCHLVMLLRTERGKEKGLNPAEWRWKLGKDCSEKWFEVLFSVVFPNITLKINGALQTPFKIAEDYPMYSTTNPTKWSVGASWQGRKGRYDQFFGGELTKLVLYLSELKDASVLSCVGGCQEGITTMNDNNPISSVSNRLELFSDGNNVTTLVEKLGKVLYVNQDPFLSPETRRIQIKTRIICTFSADVCPYSPSLELTVKISPPSNPIIVLVGKKEIAIESEDLKSSEIRPFAKLFASLRDNLMSGNRTQSQPAYLDACFVVVTPQNQLENLHLPSSNLYCSFLSDDLKNGFLFRGHRTVESYQNLIESVVYRSKIPVEKNYKVFFKLQCHNWKEQRNTNTYVLAVFASSAGHSSFYPAKIPDVNPLIPLADRLPIPASIMGGPANMLIGAVQPGNVQDPFSSATINGQNDNVVAVVVGCSIGVFVLLIFVIVVIRFQGCLPEDEDEMIDDLIVDELKEMEETEIGQEEMEWDDSAITITINPMEGDDNSVNSSDAEISEIDDDDFISDHDKLDHKRRHEELM